MFLYVTGDILRVKDGTMKTFQGKGSGNSKNALEGERVKKDASLLFLHHRLLSVDFSLSEDVIARLHPAFPQRAGVREE